MVLPELNGNNITNAARDAGIKNPVHAAEIIRMMIELKSNPEILAYMKERYGTKWRGNTLKRKFISLLQSFIIHNHYDDFREFCRLNGIAIFNGDLDVTRMDATYARFIFISFLRENMLMKRTMEITIEKALKSGRPERQARGDDVRI